MERSKPVRGNYEWVVVREAPNISAKAVSHSDRVECTATRCVNY